MGGSAPLHLDEVIPRGKEGIVVGRQVLLKLAQVEFLSRILQVCRQSGRRTGRHPWEHESREVTAVRRGEELVRDGQENEGRYYK